MKLSVKLIQSLQVTLQAGVSTVCDCTDSGFLVTQDHSVTSANLHSRESTCGARLLSATHTPADVYSHLTHHPHALHTCGPVTSQEVSMLQVSHTNCSIDFIDLRLCATAASTTCRCSLANSFAISFGTSVHCLMSSLAAAAHLHHKRPLLRKWWTGEEGCHCSSRWRAREMASGN